MPDYTRLPFHMPGHKRNTELLGGDLPYSIDITEIDGADDLHDMSGRFAELSALAARLYGADAAFPMVNGSTGGILAAVRAAARGKNGGAIALSRGSHRSVYNAVELCGLTPVYLENTAVADIPDLRCVLVTSPTYLGAVADIAAIAEAAHARGVPLIVDAAHGAHFGFSDAFPKNAARLGADIEIVSLHKTLPALTQSSLALARGGLVPAKELEIQLRVFETSSPSYVLLESIDRCLRLLEARGAELFEAYERRLRRFYERTGLAPAGDIGKIVIPAANGREMMQVFREKYNIELEMCGSDYALAMTSIADTDANFDALSGATIRERVVGTPPPTVRYHIPRRACSPQEARQNVGEFVHYREAVGRTSREYVWAYPPGVPLIVPGEVIDAEAVAELDAAEPKSDYGEIPKISVY